MPCTFVSQRFPLMFGILPAALSNVFKTCIKHSGYCLQRYIFRHCDNLDVTYIPAACRAGTCYTSLYIGYSVLQCQNQRSTLLYSDPARHSPCNPLLLPVRKEQIGVTACTPSCTFDMSRQNSCFNHNALIQFFQVQHTFAVIG
ncbi:hypothetical protein D3C81_1576480 [compost metagenome]